jgi:hypothetical protein
VVEQADGEPALVTGVQAGRGIGHDLRLSAAGLRHRCRPGGRSVNFQQNVSRCLESLKISSRLEPEHQVTGKPG